MTNCDHVETFIIDTVSHWLCYLSDTQSQHLSADEGNIMKTIYAVTEGSYSDFRVRALFSTKEKAEDLMRLVPNADYNDIEEYELNPNTSYLVKRGYAPYDVVMLKDGEVEYIEKRKTTCYFLTEECCVWKRSGSGFHEGKPDVIRARVVAKNEKHAVKIANEKRAQSIANGEWE